MNGQREEGQPERVAIIGLGTSGEAAARLALAKGAEVHVTDKNNNDATSARGAVLRGLGAEVRLGEHRVEEIARADTVVVSPGIAPGVPILAALRARGVDWVSEPEFAGRFLGAPLTIVTGTNGKTTTAALAAHLLAAAGVNAALGGNVGGGLGPPASTLALMEPAPDRIVLELSSFQLADTRALTPDTGVMTNLGVDHMDRYATVADYHRDKRRLFEAGSPRTTWVLNGDDRAVLAMAEGFPGRPVRFSVEEAARPGAWLAGDAFLVELGEEGAAAPVRVAERRDLALLGRHNAANALAALLAAIAAPEAARALVAEEGAAAALRSFPPLPHRLEPVGAVRGVRWVNDSKATNLGAALSAVESLEGPLVLLLGGSDKGEDFRGLLAARGRRVRAAVAYGEAGGRVVRELASAPFPVLRVRGSFAEAVAAGQRAARPGDTLLLAPACSSFDMFANYMERGDAFRRMAQRGGRTG